MSGTPKDEGRAGARDPVVSASEWALRRLLEDAVGGGYGAAGERDAREARPLFQRALAAALIALLVAAALWAAKDLRGVRFGSSSAVDLLREQAQDALGTQESLEGELAALQGEVQELRAQLLETTNDTIVAQGRTLGALIGSEPVRGPGVTITLDDTSALNSDQTVQDFDLQVVVNALWSAGAEAIAIDGQRLATQSSIRNAGEAILVNLTPLASPYTIEAIGDPTDLQVRLARTRAAGHLAVLRDTYGITVTVQATDSITMAAAAGGRIEHAVTVDDDAGAGRS